MKTGRHPGCEQVSTFECIDHKWFVCNTHLARYHSKCKTSPFGNEEEGWQRLEVIEKLIKQIKQHFIVFNTEDLYPGSMKDIREIDQAYLNLFKEYGDVVSKSNYFKMRVISDDALELMARLEDSKAKANYSNHLIQLISDDLKFHSININTEMLENYLLKFKEETTKKIKAEGANEKAIEMQAFIEQKEIEFEASKLEFEQNLERKYTETINRLNEEIKTNREQINSMNSEIAAHKSALKDTEDQNSRHIEEGKTITAQLKGIQPIDYDTLSAVFNRGRNTGWKMDANSTLSLDLSNYEYTYLLSVLKNIKLPKLYSVGIDGIGDMMVNNDVVRLLSFSLPHFLKNFRLNDSSVSQYILPGHKYINSFKVALPKFTGEVLVNYIDLDKEALETIFKYSHQCKRLRISNAKLPTEGPYQFEAAEGEHKIESLNFEGCGSNHSNDWSNHFDRFSAIVEAIGACSLAKSLKEINVKNCELDIQQVIECFITNGMDVEVIDTHEYAST